MSANVPGIERCRCCSNIARWRFDRQVNGGLPLALPPDRTVELASERALT
jgi:hypothetical protein